MRVMKCSGPSKSFATTATARSSVCVGLIPMTHLNCKPTSTAIARFTTSSAHTDLWMVLPYCLFARFSNGSSKPGVLQQIVVAEPPAQRAGRHHRRTSGSIIRLSWPGRRTIGRCMRRVGRGASGVLVTVGVGPMPVCASKSYGPNSVTLP